MANVTRCDSDDAHAAHRPCPGREKCAKCGVLTWRDQMVKITELRQHNGKYRHPGCRF